MKTKTKTKTIAADKPPKPPAKDPQVLLRARLKSGKNVEWPTMKKEALTKVKSQGPNPWIEHAQKKWGSPAYQIDAVLVTYKPAWNGSQWLQIPDEEKIWHWDQWQSGAAVAGADPTYAESFQKLLAYINALYHTYYFLHWQSSGQNYYGDHLLFQRLHESTGEEIDTVAEKAIGLTNDPAVISPIQHSTLMSDFLTKFADGAQDGINASLRAERGLVILISQIRESLEGQGKLTNGLDNMLQGIADNHEGHIYLLQQRLSNPQGAQAVTATANVFKKGERVKVKTQSGKVELGIVNYVRMDHLKDFKEPAAYSILLDSQQDRPGYSGSLFPASSVSKASVVAAIDPYVQKIADVLKANPNLALMSLRPHLEKIFKPRDISFITSPVAAFMIKVKGKTLVIVNKQYADDPEVVVGPLAIGYIGAKAATVEAADAEPAKSDPPRIAKIRQIVEEHQAAKIDGSLVDAWTAKLLITIYDNLNEVNRLKFAEMKVQRMADLGWKMVNRGAIKMGAQTVTTASFDTKAKQETIAVLLRAKRPDLIKEVMALSPSNIPSAVMEAFNNLQSAKQLRYPGSTIQNLYKAFVQVCQQNRINPQKLLATASVKVQADQGNTSYDWLPKAVLMMRGLIKSLIADKRQDQIPDNLAAVIKTVVPQAFQNKVFRDLRTKLATPKDI